MEVSGDVSATRPVEAPSASIEPLPTGQDASLPFATDRPVVQPPGPTNETLTGGRSDFQSPVPAKKHSSAVSGPTVSVEELASETGNVSDQSSSMADEGEVSDLESTGPVQEDMLEGGPRTVC